MQDLSDYAPRRLPGEATLVGRMVRVEPYDEDRHGAGLAEAVAGPGNLTTWQYMPRGPYPDKSRFVEEFGTWVTGDNWNSYVIVDKASDTVTGTASYMRQRPANGSIEIGAVAFSHTLRRSTHATEAIFLMASHVFEDLGYRRFEWKCHNENAASKRAAERFGFLYEGIFRNDMVMKGKNRDTAWYAMTDDDWPAIKAGFVAWLSPSNFDANGQQKASLEALRASR